MQSRSMPAQQKDLAVNLYWRGFPEDHIATATGYTTVTIERIIAPAKREFALQLFNIGFTDKEIAAQTGYKPVDVRRILTDAASEGQHTSQSRGSERLEQGLRNFVQYASTQESYLSIRKYQNRAMRAFGIVKLPQIIKPVVSSITLEDLLAPPKDPYESLLFKIGYGDWINTTNMTRYAFFAYVHSENQSQGINIVDLTDYLRQKVIFSLKEALKIPVFVDKDKLEAALKTLSPREEEVLRKRFLEGKSLKDVSGDYNRSEERVRQIEARGIKYLRHPRRGIVKYADPQILLSHAHRLEEIVAKQEGKIQEKDRIIRAYKTIYGPLPTQEIQSQIAHDLLQQTLDRSIYELGISVRACNACEVCGIRTIRDLVQKTESELLKVRNFGRKSLNELKTILAETGLELGMILPESQE